MHIEPDALTWAFSERTRQNKRPITKAMITTAMTQFFIDCQKLERNRFRAPRAATARTTVISIRQMLHKDGKARLQLLCPVPEPGGIMKDQYGSAREHCQQPQGKQARVPQHQFIDNATASSNTCSRGTPFLRMLLGAGMMGALLVVRRLPAALVAVGVLWVPEVSACCTAEVAASGN